MRDQSLVMFLAVQSLIGCVLAVGFVGSLMFFDVANLRTLLLGSGHGWAWSAVLTFLLASTVASAQVGFALFTDEENQR